MRLSNLADYAVVAMRAAATHCGGVKANAAGLAEETGLPAPTVQKLVSRLSAAGLLRSTRGAGGGIRLARPAAAITLADIVEAVEGPIVLTQCGDTGGGDCAIEHTCNVRPHWPQVNRAIRGALAGITLADLAKEEEAA
ncbi:SUF system Fe-S cluster assembly regulator [Croceicoccus mobilis]|uniref:Transcriptional regulator n=1 Tax=Croceicoccus mobilis TaxID=1703339 RepID=A0A916YU21_9SPHN|nr:SUF system Fe-S cluster assembly regulator [Croceicoccus mobilis]GGD60414.1 transcriptional regulator [Croceicoccus mobilis]